MVLIPEREPARDLGPDLIRFFRRIAPLGTRDYICQALVPFQGTKLVGAPVSQGREAHPGLCAKSPSGTKGRRGRLHWQLQFDLFVDRINLWYRELVVFDEMIDEHAHVVIPKLAITLIQ